MVSDSALYDTNILIDFLNGIGAARTECEQCADRAISIVTWIEVMAGAEPGSEEASTRRFLSRYRLLQISRPVAEQTAKIRRTMRIKLPDAIILATAWTTGRTLVTRNTRDFPPDLPGVRVPYTL